MLLHLKKYNKPITYEEEREIFQEIKKNPKIINEIKKNIHMKGIFKDFEEINDYEEDSIKYNITKHRIINVNEYVN